MTHDGGTYGWQPVEPSGIVADRDAVVVPQPGPGAVRQAGSFDEYLAGLGRADAGG